MSNNEGFANFLEQYPKTRYLDVFYNDLSCVIRGKRYPIDQADKLFKSGMMVPGSSMLLAASGECLDPEGMGFSDGDPDEVGVVIPGTLAPTPWAQYPTAQTMITLQSLDGKPYFYEPRNVLRRVLGKFETMNLRPVAAFELEFYLLDLETDESGSLQPPRSPLSGQRANSTQVYSMQDLDDFADFFDQVMRACEMQNIKTGAISAEYSPAQFEINLQHTGDLLRAADECVMFKRAVQCVARKHGMRATFMPKPYANNSGSGLHLHLSLLNQQDVNVFDGGGDYGNMSCISENLRYAIAGLLQTMQDAFAVFAPSAVSYRRFQPDIYVPVSPSWGFENRSVAVRIPKSLGSARRIEHRVAGADANPYLTLAALLAGIHYGITNKLNPGETCATNAGTQLDPTLPFQPLVAFERMRNSTILPDYFGKPYVDAYTSCKRLEFEALENNSAKELEWYL